MKKRIISGALALIVAGVSISSMFISASAELATAAVTVGMGLVFSWILNEMTGGTGYDLSDAIGDMIEVTIDWCEGVPGAIELGTEYWITGVNMIGDGVSNYFDSLGDVGAAVFDFQGTIFEGYDPETVLRATINQLSSKIAAGDIVVGYDENGDIVLSTKDYCDFIDSIYEEFGAEINGDSRTYNRIDFVSDYVEWYSVGSSFSTNYFHAAYYLNGTYKWNVFPFMVTDNGLYYFDTCLHYSNMDAGSFMIYINGTNTRLEPKLNTSDYMYSYRDYDYKSYSEFKSDIIIAGSFSPLEISTSASHPIATGNPGTVSALFADYGGLTVLNSSQTYNDIEENEDVLNYGWVSVNDYTKFRNYCKSDSFSDTADVISGTIGNTLTEDVIQGMGLEGVGESTRPGTVTVDKSGDVTVTDTQTGAAELVQPKPSLGDIDVPSGNTIIDKFPFSLPFDLYRLLTIFVADPKEPIFTIPIQTGFEMSGLEVEIDEEVELDFTQFKIGGVDFIQVLVQTGFYLLFTVFLIKITPSMIKH